MPRDRVAFAAEGASVVVAGRTAASLDETVGLVAAAEEVAAAVLYLASPMAGAVVGTGLVIDSGSSA